MYLIYQMTVKNFILLHRIISRSRSTNKYICLLLLKQPNRKQPCKINNSVLELRLLRALKTIQTFSHFILFFFCVN